MLSGLMGSQEAAAGGTLLPLAPTRSLVRVGVTSRCGGVQLSAIRDLLWSFVLSVKFGDWETRAHAVRVLVWSKGSLSVSFSVGGVVLLKVHLHIADPFC